MNKQASIRVLSLGAGVQSSTLALMAKHGETDPVDCAIFADTQAEPKSVYDWLDWLETQLPYPVYRVSRGDLSEIAIKVRTSKRGGHYQQSAPPAWVIDDGHKLGVMLRQCTKDFKIDPIRRKLRELGGKERGVDQWLGISLDEAHRMKPSRDSWITNRWPLIEKRMSRGDCLAWMDRMGYPMPLRSSCFFCPYHSDQEWKSMKLHDPHAFSRAIQFEKDFQLAMAQVEAFRGTPYLHRLCKPLSDIDFTDSAQTDLFGNECEGLCGV